MATKTLTAKQLLERLSKLKFFDGYTKKAQAIAEGQISDRFDKAMANRQRRFFERFPATATASLTVYGEWDGEPFELLVESYANASCGMFRPTAVKDTRNKTGDTMTLSFKVGGQSYSATVDCEGWVPTEFLELLDRAVKKSCKGLAFHNLYFGGLTDSPSFAFCKKRAFDALVKSKLVCIDDKVAFSDEWE